MAQINISLEERLNTLVSYLNECKSVDSYPTLLEQDIDDILHCISFTLQGSANKQTQSFEEVLEEASTSARIDDVRDKGMKIHVESSHVDDGIVVSILYLYKHSLYLVVDRVVQVHPYDKLENIEFVKIH